MEYDDIEIIDNVTADSLGSGDQIIIEGDLFIIHTVDTDREDIDEVFVTGENLTDPTENSFPLFADDRFDVWSL